MPDTHHHICFISDQNVAELLGALLYEPAGIRIHAIATPRMAAKAAAFESTCLRNGIECSIYPLETVGIEEIGKLLDAIHGERTSDNWAVNITGGTKLMTLAAFAWASRHNIAAFYIDTASRVINFHQAAQWRKLRLPSILKYEPLLNIYGYEIENRALPRMFPEKRAASEKMVGFLCQPHGLETLHLLNSCALIASANPKLTTEYNPSHSFNRLLGICRGAGKLEYTNSHIAFKDESARQWCHGIWLEEYVQTVLARLQAENRITSWAANAIINGYGYYNELDALFTANNRLHIIECKTSRISGRSSASTILYKAHSLNDRVGGIFTRSLLCALEPLTGPEEQRAKNMGIKAVVGPELKNLKEILTEWIETA